MVTRQTGITLAKSLVSLRLLFLVARSHDLRTLQSDLLAINWAAFLFAILLLLVQTFVLNGRWILILRAIGVPLDWLTGWRIFMISAWFNQILPSGGDFVRMWMLRRNHVRWSSALKSVLADRFTALLSLIVLMLAGLPFLFIRYGNLSLVVPLAGVVAAGIIGTVALVTLDRWPRFIVSIPFFKNFVRFGALIELLLFKIPERGILFCSAILVHLLTVAACYVLAAGLQVNLLAFDALLLIPPVILLSAIPISIGGWGIREGAMVVSLAMAGITSDKALAVSVLLGLASVIVGLAGAAVWLIAPERTSFAAAPAPSAANDSDAENIKQW